MPDQFGNFADDISNLQQQLTPAQIARILGAGAQSAVSGVAGMPGDISNYTGLPPASGLPGASGQPSASGLSLLSMFTNPYIFGKAMAGGRMLLNGQLTGRTPTYAQPAAFNDTYLQSGMQNPNYQPTGQLAANQPPASQLPISQPMTNQQPASWPSWLSQLLSGQHGPLTGVQPCRRATAPQRSHTEAGEAGRRSRPLRSAGRLPAFCAPRVPWSDIKTYPSTAPTSHPCLPHCASSFCRHFFGRILKFVSIVGSVTVARQHQITALFAKVRVADRRLLS
jgi:hypothetical protein